LLKNKKKQHIEVASKHKGTVAELLYLQAHRCRKIRVFWLKLDQNVVTATFGNKLIAAKKIVP